jgi:hypothetical protein
MPNVVDRLGGASSSLAFKAPCRLATTANITLSGYQTIDGTLPTSSQHADLRRILVRNQTDSAENGIYIMDTGTWERAKDFDGANDFRQGTRVYVYGGSTQSGTYLVSSSMDPASFDFGDDDITFAEVGTFDQETSSLGIASGGKISFNSDDVTITHSSSALTFAGAGAGFTFSEGVTASSALTVSGAVTLSSAVSMTGAVTASSAVTMSGAVTMSSAATLSGAVTISSAATLSGAVTLSSAVSLTGTLTASSASTVAINGSFTSSALTASGLISGSAGMSAGSSFTSSGNINAVSGTTITAGGVAGKGIMMFGSTTFGIYAGSGAPTIAAGQGSLYLRTDATSSLTRAYFQSSGSTNTWVGLLTTA